VNRQNAIIGILNTSLGAATVRAMMAAGRITFSMNNNPTAANPSLTIQQNVTVPQTESHIVTQEDTNGSPQLNGQ